jgi:hypothetical protein
VVVSKIFPAGFGWQASSAVAEGMGFESDQGGFFLITGAGDTPPWPARIDFGQLDTPQPTASL